MTPLAIRLAALALPLAAAAATAQDALFALRATEAQPTYDAPPTGLTLRPGGPVSQVEAGDVYDVLDVARVTTGVGRQDVWVRIAPQGAPPDSPQGAPDAGGWAIHRTDRLPGRAAFAPVGDVPTFYAPLLGLMPGE